MNKGTNKGYRGNKMVRWFLEGDQWPEERDWQTVEPGNLDLSGENLAGVNASRLPAFLSRYGHLVAHLALESRYFEPSARIDLSALDFAQSLPNLRRLWLQGCSLNLSAFAPTKLEKLHLVECGIVGEDHLALGQIAGGAGFLLEEIALHRCHLPLSRLSFGAHAGLRDFDYRREPFEENDHPQTFVFNDCGELCRAVFDLKGRFEVKLAGALPRLQELRLDAGAAGTAGLDSSTLTSASFDLVQKIHI